MITNEIIKNLQLSEYFINNNFCVGKEWNPIYQLDEGVLINCTELSTSLNKDTKVQIYSKHNGYTLVINASIDFLERKSRKDLLDFIIERNDEIMKYYDKNNIKGVIRYDSALSVPQ